jgi:hypothetical protein
VSPDLILFLAANPAGTSRLCLAEECAAIERELRVAANRDFEFQSRWAVTIDELMHHLNAMRPTVIHFSGHGSGGHVTAGSPAPARDVAAAEWGDSAGIYLQDEAGAPQLVTADALTAMIESVASSARIVVLNACYSDAHADALCRVVDCVVGMGGPIGDDAARAFAMSFYRALAHQRSVGNAVAQVSATLAAKQLPGHHLPRCRTRGGVDANRVLLSSHVARDESWARKFEAIIRLSQAASDKLESDPLSAAMRARQAIEHIVDYLYERELAATERNQSLDARFERVDAKLVISPLVASHFRSVLAHTDLAIQVAGVASDPSPALLSPCLGSLAIAVEWFFHDYLKRPEVNLGWGAAGWALADRPPAPDAVPLNSTMTTVADTGAQAAIDIGEFTPIWRTTPVASLLRLAPADGDAQDQRVFRIEDPTRTYPIGRTDQRSDGTRNDFVLPSSWISVSRDQGHLATCDQGVLLMNTSSNNSVFVRGERIVAGAARLLRHGDIVQLGRCVGTFTDGRYYAATPAAAVDRRTGLLSRLGLIAEISGSLAIGDHRVLFVLRCPERATAAVRGGGPADPERLAASVAIAIHRHAPSRPVARLGMHVAALLVAEDQVGAIAAVARAVVGARCVSGFATLVGMADQATPRLEACLGALNRIAIAGWEAGGPEDLAPHALVPTPLHAFARHARSLLELGGGAVVFALGDLARLNRVVPQAVPVLEQELLELLGARMGPRDVVSFADPGALLFATSGDVARCAHEVSVAWHARGPVTADRFEIDRWLSARTLAVTELDGIAERVAAFARGEDCTSRASGLPAPLARAAQEVDLARDPLDRARALVRLAELSWKLLAFILVAASRGTCERVAPTDSAGADPWPGPWRALARAAALRLDGQARRLVELASVAVSPDRDAQLGRAMQVTAEYARLVAAARPDPAVVAHGLPQLESAVLALLAALAPLRGWTLVGIVRSEIVDPDGTMQRIEYVDHTGPSARGSHQRVMVTSLRSMGRFVYLVRWNEGLAIALEPFVRRARNETTGDGELFLATVPIAEPGRHRYRSAHDTREIEQVVTIKQLGRSASEEGHG